MMLVVNSSAPEVDYLAASLADAGLLSKYLRPYANMGRRWEKAMACLPGFGEIYARSFGRRKMPSGLLLEHLCEAAVSLDMISAGARLVLGKKGGQLSERLQWEVQKRIGAVSAKDAVDANVVIANYAVAEQAFQRTRGVKILNYPIAHHRYIRDFVAEEAELEPEFARTLPNWDGVPEWVEPRLDAECGMADAIFVGSSFARNSFIASGLPAEKLVTIPYGANVSLFSPKDEELPALDQHFRVLFVGQIGQRKGISYLLRAYRTFKDSGTHLTLVGSFYGDSAWLATYHDLFEHVPHMPRTALAKQYRRASVFVFPTLIEGLGIVVLEAMASGLPVITTPNGPGDIVRDGVDGFIVPIRDADAIATKLKYLRDNPDVCREMGRNARRRALEYTWTAYQLHAKSEVLRLARRETALLA